LPMARRIPLPLSPWKLNGKSGSINTAPYLATITQPRQLLTHGTAEGRSPYAHILGFACHGRCVVAEPLRFSYSFVDGLHRYDFPEAPIDGVFLTIETPGRNHLGQLWGRVSTKS
jgi:hypothetical protein